MRGIEQIPWLYDLGMALVETTGLGRWRAWLTGGCHPNRDTEAAVAAAGFVVDPPSYRARNEMRRFEARRGQHQGPTLTARGC